MTKLKVLTAAIVAAGIMLGVQNAQAHCDSLDGPVAKAVQKALETGNINPVLAYAPAAAEAEIRAAFEKSRKVRGLGADARALADQAVMETVIRLHRAGEGAAYTGLKPAGIDYGPVIPAAEHAVDEQRGGQRPASFPRVRHAAGVVLRDRLRVTFLDRRSVPLLRLALVVRGEPGEAERGGGADAHADRARSR